MGCVPIFVISSYQDLLGTYIEDLHIPEYGEYLEHLCHQIVLEECIHLFLLQRVPERYAVRDSAIVKDVPLK